MDGAKTSLWLFLLLNPLPFCLSDDGQNNSTMQPHRYDNGTDEVTAFPDAGTNGTRGDCLIDTEMGLIALGSAGGFIVCLLAAIVVLACEVCRLQRRPGSGPRTSQSNIDLVSSAAYWGADQAEVQGLVGPCDASYAKDEMENGRQGAMVMQEMAEEEEGDYEEGAAAFQPRDTDEDGQMPSAHVRDSCLVIPPNLEDMPLMV